MSPALATITDRPDLAPVVGGWTWEAWSQARAATLEQRIAPSPAGMVGPTNRRARLSAVAGTAAAAVPSFRGVPAIGAPARSNG